MAATCLAVALIFVCLPVAAQTPTTLQGRVFDPPGAVAPAATVDVRPPSRALPASPGVVLTLHWGSADSPSTPIVDTAIRAALEGEGWRPIDYYTEYLESDRFPDPAATLAFRDYVREKYRGRRIDAVIAISDAAFAFARRFGSELFPDAPIAALVSSAPDDRTRRAGPGITGVVAGAAYRRTLQLALTLHPKARRVYVIAHAPTTSLVDRVSAELRPDPPGVSVAYIDEPDVERMLAAVRAVPADSLVLYIRHSRDEPGRNLHPADVAELVSAASPVPVYGISDAYLATGVVGGVVSSREGIGTQLGTLTRELLRGVRAQDLPMQPVALAPTFDGRQLARWRISTAALPQGSTVLFRQPTFWALYRRYVIGAVALLSLQGALIVALLAQRRHRRGIEAALRGSEEHFRTLADNAPVLIWRSGIDGRCDFLNKPWLTFTGMSLEDATGEGWFGAVHPDDLARCLAIYEGAFARHDSYTLECRLRRHDGAFRWLLVTGAPRHDAGGTFLGYFGSCVDVTDKKEAEAALHESHAELNRLSRLAALGEFAASIAHELRQPLTAIMLNARSCLHTLATPSPSADDLTSGLLDVVEACRRADQVIRRNEDLFRHHRVYAAPMDVNQVIRESLALAEPRLSAHGVQAVVTLSPHLPMIHGDRVELQQVLLNLVTNAIDAMANTLPERRHIEVSSHADTHEVTVSVRDHGVGLEGVDPKRIFAPLYTTKPQGSGVGLSISRSIVDAHGGRLWAESHMEGGATFFFSLPLKSAADVQSPAVVSRTY